MDAEFHAETQALMLLLCAKHEAREKVIEAAREVSEAWISIPYTALKDCVKVLREALATMDALNAGDEPERDWQEGMPHG